jgi:CHAT domain-containing protein
MPRLAVTVLSMSILLCTPVIAQESNSLEAGKPIERELSVSQSHSYKLPIISGQYLKIVVDQRGIDVAVVLSAPDGKKVSEVNSNHSIEGSETLSMIADLPGAYLMEVRSAQKIAKTGRYEVKVKELRAATVEDKYRVFAGTKSREAEQLQNGTLEDRRKSIEKYQEALELYRKANDRVGETETLNNSGAVYYTLGETPKALEQYKEALLISRGAGDRRGEASALNDLGLVYWSLGEMQKALDHLNEALPIRQALSDRSGVAITLNNLGLVLRSLGEMQKALEVLNQSLKLRKTVGDRKEEAITLNNIGLVHTSLGEFQKALETYNEVLPIRRAVGDRNGEAITLNNIGTIYRYSGNMEKALEKYKEALPIFQVLGNRRGEAITLSNIGGVNRFLGEFQKSLENYEEALQISRAIGDRRAQAVTLNNIGTIYNLLGEKTKALEKYHEALPIRRAVVDRSGLATTLINIGATLLSLGEFQNALVNFNEALPIFQAVDNPIGEATCLLGSARVEQKSGNLTKARQSIEQSIKIVESIRADYDSPELRTSFFASKQEFYEAYIDVLMHMHRQNQAASFDALALAVNERARARSLLELLNEARADIRQGVDSSLLERERSLRQRLAARAAAQANLLNRRHTSEQAEAAAKEIASITAEYEELEAKIRATSPKYAALTQPQPLSLAEIQKQVLDPETLLLEYSLGEDASYLFAVSQTSITSHQLPKRSVIETATRRLRELLTAPQPRAGEAEAKRQDWIKEAREKYWREAAVLSRMLLGPVASRLGKKRLVIVADGALQYIPFAALPVPAGENPEADPQPLMVKHEIVSLPSASTLAVLRREIAGRKPAAKSLAVLADPVFADDDTRVRRLANKAIVNGKTGPADSEEKDIPSLQMVRSARETGVIDAEAGFGRLLNTRREATAILALVPERERKQALDFQASRMTALSPELGQYRIVHFATHGLLNNIHPELSGIVLSLVNETGEAQDGFLRLQDIYNFKLPVELAVLSACQTGLGKEIKREGLIGLTRGFMYAGTPRIVASLWKVDDRATSELMKRFYQGMLGVERMRPAEALRQAQLSIWKQKQWRAPYYWAAFVLQGEWR